MTEKKEGGSKENTEKVTEETKNPVSKASGEKNATESTIPAAVQKQLDDQAKAIADLESDLKDAQKDRDTFKKSSEANAKELEKLKSQQTEQQGEDFEKKYNDLKAEFDTYKEIHQKGIEDNDAALIEKRQQGQKLINARETIKKLTVEFSKNVEDALK